MPMRATKRKARQRSGQNLDNSPGTIFQRLGTVKSSFTDEKLLQITQQIQCKRARKMKDEYQKNENAILRALSSLSEISTSGTVNDMNVGTTLRGEESGLNCLELYGLDSDQENVIPENVLSDQQTDT